MLGIAFTSFFHFFGLYTYSFNWFCSKGERVAEKTFIKVYFHNIVHRGHKQRLYTLRPVCGVSPIASAPFLMQNLAVSEGSGSSIKQINWELWSKNCGFLRFKLLQAKKNLLAVRVKRASFICRSGSEKPFTWGSAALTTQCSRKLLFSNRTSIYFRKVCSGCMCRLNTGSCHVLKLKPGMCLRKH